MKQNKLPKEIPKITSTTIDAAVLARINEKVAIAHEQNRNQKQFLYRKYKTKAETSTLRVSNLDR